MKARVKWWSPGEAAIVIQPLTAANQAGLNRCDNAFTVEAELRLTAEDGRIRYTVQPVTPYVKRYNPKVYDVQHISATPITPRGWPTWTAGSPGKFSSMRTGIAVPSSGTSPWTRPSVAGASAAG